MTTAGETGGLGYFKGVMLCARPVERNVRPERVSFCPTVTGRGELGVDPAHKLKPRRERKRVVTAIVNHRRWLEQLSQEMETRKQRTVDEMLQEELRRMKIKQKSEQARELVKGDQASLIKTQVYPLFHPGDVSLANQYARSHSERVAHREPGPSQLGANSNNIFRAASSNKVTEKEKDKANWKDVPPKEPLEKTVQFNLGSGGAAGLPVSQLETTLKKPVVSTAPKNSVNGWSKAAAAEEQDMEAEIGDLLSFMENFDAEKYAEDVETRALMASLKGRVDKLKQEPNWKEKWEERIKEKRRKREEEYRKQKEEKEADDDARSNVGNDSQLGIGGGSLGSRGDAKSIQSERTQGSLVRDSRGHPCNQGEGRSKVSRKR